MIELSQKLGSVQTIGVSLNKNWGEFMCRQKSEVIKILGKSWVQFKRLRAISQQIIESMKQIFFSEKCIPHSNQEMLHDRNKCSQKCIFGVETVCLTAWSKKQCAINGPVKCKVI